MRRREKPVPHGMSGRRKSKRPSVKDITIKPTVKLYVIARGQRGQNRRLQPFAGGGSGLPATRTINRTVIFHSGRMPGRPPRVCEGCGPPEGRRPARPLTRKLNCNRRVFIDAIHQNHRLSRCLRALRPGVCSDGVGAKPNGASILTLRFLAQVRSLRGIGYLQPGSSAERHRASREEASGPPANTET